MPQFARPDEDITISNWTGDPDNTDRYKNVDEEVSSQVDEINWTIGGNELILGFSDLIDPLSSSDHVFRLTVENQMVYQLRQGSTVIASGSQGNQGYNLRTITLTSDEADSITDYTDLNARIQGGGIFGARVAWIEFEVPDLPAGGGVTINSRKRWPLSRRFHKK